MTGQKAAEFAMIHSQKRCLTTKPQQPPTLFLKLEHTGSSHHQSKMSRRKTKSNPDKDIEQMIEAKVALALRVLKF